MTIAQAKKKIEAARKTGRARFFCEADRTTYDIWYYPETREFSLTYRDGHYEQTVICTANTNKLIDLITA